MQNLHLLIGYRECLPIYQISNSQHLLEYVSFFILIVITDRISVLIQESLSKAVLAFLNRLEVLNATQDFVKILLHIQSDIVRVRALRYNQDVGLVRLHIFFHLVVDFDRVFVV